MPRSSISNSRSAIQKRPRGAPKGNLNAAKHGFYASNLDLSIPPQDFQGLKDEITRLRLLVRRQVERVKASSSHTQYTDNFRLLCLACLTLNRLLRTHLLLAHGPFDAALALDASLEELAGTAQAPLLEEDGSSTPPTTHDPLDEFERMRLARLSAPDASPPPSPESSP